MKTTSVAYPNFSETVLSNYNLSRTPLDLDSLDHILYVNHCPFYRDVVEPRSCAHL